MPVPNLTELCQQYYIFYVNGSDFRKSVLNFYEDRKFFMRIMIFVLRLNKSRIFNKNTMKKLNNLKNKQRFLPLISCSKMQIFLPSTKILLMTFKFFYLTKRFFKHHFTLISYHIYSPFSKLFFFIHACCTKFLVLCSHRNFLLKLIMWKIAVHTKKFIPQTHVSPFTFVL